MLRRLRIRNLRSLVDLQSPEFGRVNVILGPNGSGKSTIRDAITLLFTGTATGVETGIGLDRLRNVRSPSKRWQIDAQGESENVLTRTDDEGPRSAKQTLAENMTSVSGGIMRAALEAGEFVRLDSKARQKLLLELAPPPSVALPPAVRSEVRALLGEDLEAVPATGFDRLYKSAYELRAEAARGVKAIGDLGGPEIPADLGAMATAVGARVTIKWLKPLLADCRADLALYRQDRDDARLKAYPAAIDLGPMRRAEARSANDLEAVRAEIGTLPSKMEIKVKAQTILAKLANATETNAAIEASRVRLRESLGEADGGMRQAKAALAVVRAQRGEVGTCPVCESKLTKVNRRKLEETLEGKVDAAGRAWQRIKEELEASTERKSAADLEAESDALAAKEVRLVRLLDDEKRLAARLLDERGALAAAETHAVSADTTAEAEIEDLEERIANGERLVEQIVQAIAALQTYEDQVGRKAELMKRHARLDDLVAQLGPTGLRAGAGGDASFRFSADLNARLADRGFLVDLRPAMDLTGDPLVFVRDVKTPLGLLSDGERLIFGAAFAVSVAEVTGLGLVVIDNFERLDPDAGDDVLAMLEGMDRDGGPAPQAFVLSVEREPDSERIAAEVNAAGGSTRMFLLREGQLLAPGLEVKV